MTRFNLAMVSTLMDIQSKLYASPLLTHDKLDGIFYRGQDFTQSHAQLNETFFEEHRVASDAFPKSKNADELHGNVANEFQIHSSGQDHFTTVNLSPALRHFINDSCRLLEPFATVLAEIYTDVALGRREAFNSYIKRLRAANKQLNFDVDFILELYEVWNDYKHRGTVGVHATPWKYNSGKVIKSKLGLPALEITIAKLADIDVDDFQNQTSVKILELLDFVAGQLTSDNK